MDLGNYTKCYWRYSVFYLLYCLIKNKQIYHNGGAIVTISGKRWGGISLGMFIFLDDYYDQDDIKHEYGHTLQSMLLGVFYLPIIGIASLYWNRFCSDTYLATYNGYYKFWTERWADRLGKVNREFEEK